MRIDRLFVAACLAITLSACGGGGGGGPSNRAPVAVAGVDQSVATGVTVILNGTASSDPDGNAISYSWALVSKPEDSVTSLGDATTANAHFLADKEGDYVVALTVNDGSLSSAAVTTTVHALFDVDTAASNSGLMAVTDSVTSTVTVSWVDLFPLGSVYRIEKLTPTGFAPVEISSGLDGALASGGNILSWRTPYLGPVSYRVVGVTPTHREAPLLTQTPHSAVVGVFAPDIDPMLIPGAAEPIGGANVPVSQFPAPASSGVRWNYDDYQDLCCDNPVFWDTTNTPNGMHLLRARYGVGGGVFRDIRGLVSSNTTTSTNVAQSFKASGSDQGLDIYYRLSGSGGTPAVTATINGVAQTLTSPNICRSYCDVPGQGGEYWFHLTGTTGTPTAEIEIGYVGGSTLHSFVSGAIPFGPGLTTTIAHEGAFVSGSLRVQGSTTSPDTPVKVRAALDGRVFLTTTSTPFDGSVDLTGIPPGNHSLSITALDKVGRVSAVRRSIVVPSNASLTPTPLFEVDDDSTIEAVQGDLVLYRKSDLTYWLWRVGDAAPVPLSNAVRILGAPKLSNNWIYARGTMPGSTAQSLFRFSASTGVPENISAADPGFGSPQSASTGPVVQDHYVAWRSGNTFIVYDAALAAYTHISSPSAIGEMDGFDLGLASGSPILFFGSSGGATDALYRWTPSGGVSSVSVSASPLAGWFVQTDGTNVAYAPRTTASTPTSYSLTLAPAGGGSAILSTVSAAPFELRAGILRFGTNTVWSAARGQVILSGLPAPNPSQRAATSLFAFYDDPGTYTWNALTGTTTLRVQGGPFAIFITGGWMYFKSGVGIYRVAVS